MLALPPRLDITLTSVGYVMVDGVTLVFSMTPVALPTQHAVAPQVGLSVPGRSAGV